MEDPPFLASSLCGVEPNKTVFNPSEERAPFANLQEAVWIPEPLCTLWRGGKYPRRVSKRASP
jgi:hypothetical protein